MAQDKRSGWYPDQRRTIYLCAVVLMGATFFTLLYAQIIWKLYQTRSATHLPHYTDFFALWSYAQVVFHHPAADLYRDEILRSYQIQLGMGADEHCPFPYPPTFILMVWPLYLLPYHMSYIVTMLATLAVFLWVVRQTCTHSPFLLLACLLAPVTIASIWAGQFGFVAGALIVGGIRLAGTRPILAGILIGVLSYKPQFGLLIPIALISARLWVAFASASAAAAAMAALATLAFGIGIWSDWIAMLPAYSDLWENVPEVLGMRPTVMATLQILGAGLLPARIVQGAVSLTVAIVVWRMFRVGPTRLAAAALLCGTMLATPHAYFYDMPMVLAAMVLFVEDRVQANRPFTTVEVGILFLAMFFPCSMLMKDVAVPGAPAVLGLLFWAIVRGADRAAPTAIRPERANGHQDTSKTSPSASVAGAGRVMPGHNGHKSKFQAVGRLPLFVSHSC